MSQPAHAAHDKMLAAVNNFIDDTFKSAVINVGKQYHIEPASSSTYGKWDMLSLRITASMQPHEVQELLEHKLLRLASTATDVYCCPAISTVSEDSGFNVVLHVSFRTAKAEPHLTVVKNAPAKTVDFADALRALRDGKRVQRSAWIPEDYLVLVPEMERTRVCENKPLANSGMPVGTGFFFPAHIYMYRFDGDNSMLIPWSVSQEDILASDWLVLP